ncbi:MAG: hypothetical protein HY887_09885 [Deltaproteobacteria bacterium]|nr:hypothetical protein [Deltaproteobacteria bacterium]
MRKAFLVILFVLLPGAALFAQFPRERGSFQGRQGQGQPFGGGQGFQKREGNRFEGGAQPRPERYENNKTDVRLAAERENSPFAFAHAWATGSNPLYNYPEYINDMKDIGVYWVRAAGFYSLNWSRMRSLDGAAKWGQMDSIVKELQYNGINLLLSINPGVGQGQSQGRGQGMMQGEALPDDLEAYSRFIQGAVERYDMDGVDDMPGLRFPVRHYLVGNEPDVPVIWRGTPEDYAVFVRTTYQAIKRASPDAKVVMGGSAGSLFQYLPAGQNPPAGLTGSLREDGRKGGDGFFVKAMRRLRAISGQDRYDDLVMDFHFYGSAGDWRAIEYFVRYIRKLEDDFGFSHFPVWVTETGTFSGEISGMVKNDLARATGQMGRTRSQDEAAQAGELVKRYAFGAANGVEKLFWFTIKGGSNPVYFENTGLLDSRSRKKPSYYAYKKMVEVLEGSGWDKIEAIQEKDGAYIYKFKKKSKSIWMAWNDGAASKTIIIETGDARQVKITKAVPRYESGKDVKDYSMAFDEEAKSTDKGKITITLGESPIFVEML